MRLLGIMVAVTMAASAQDLPYSYKPAAGYVPDATTAIRIAVAVWEPIYGEKVIASEKPYRATLKNGRWLVESSLPTSIDGGVAIAEISQSNAAVLRISHGK